jgi:deoxyadenosine kinase
MDNYTRTFSSSNPFIGISGIIGVGKSTLTTKLANELKSVKDNHYLPLFYNDMEKYGFTMQVYLLNKRFRAHQQAVWHDRGVIQDRTIYEDVIFAKMLAKTGHISAMDFDTYRELFINMTNFLHRPDIIVYLDVEPEIALERVKMRSRGCETALTVEYLQNLKEGYEDWLLDIQDRVPVIRIDWNEFQDTSVVIKKINATLKKVRKTQITV